MKHILTFATLFMTIIATASASALPKGVFSLQDLDKAKAHAAEKKQPIFFVVTDLKTSCPLCNQANDNIFKKFRSVGTFVLIKNQGAEINQAPDLLKQMYRSPATGRTIPITLVTTADVSKDLKIIPYKDLMGAQAAKVACW